MQCPEDEKRDAWWQRMRCVPLVPLQRDEALRVPSLRCMTVGDERGDVVDVDIFEYAHADSLSKGK